MGYKEIYDELYEWLINASEEYFLKMISTEEFLKVLDNAKESILSNYRSNSISKSEYKKLYKLIDSYNSLVEE